MDIAGLEPAQSITKSVGTVLKAHLGLHLQNQKMKTPKAGVWPEESGKVFDQFTGKRRDVEKKDYILSWLDYCIDESVTECPELLWNVILSGVQDEETAKKMLDILAYIVFDSNRFQRFFHFYGKERSGKSTLMRLLEALLGEHACTSVNPQELIKTEERALVNAPGKQLLTMEESEGPLPYAAIKKITGGDTLTARALWTEAAQFRHLGHVVVVSQTPMPFYDKAFEARLESVQFVLSPKKLDGKLGDKLEKIRPQIMGFLWNHWKDHIKGLNEWTSSALMEQGRQARAVSDDGYKGWINQYLESDGTNTIEIKEVRNLIVEDAEREDNELTAKDKRYLSQNIRRYAQSKGLRLNHNGKKLFATLVNREEVEEEVKKMNKVDDGGVPEFMSEDAELDTIINSVGDEDEIFN